MAVLRELGAATRAEVMRQAQMSRSTFTHHVTALEKRGVIRSVKMGHGIVYVDPSAEDLVGALSPGLPARALHVVRCLGERSNASQAELARSTGTSQGYLSKLLKRLVEAGVVQRLDACSPTRYALRADLQRSLSQRAEA